MSPIPLNLYPVSNTKYLPNSFWLNWGLSVFAAILSGYSGLGIIRRASIRFQLIFQVQGDSPNRNHLKRSKMTCSILLPTRHMNKFSGFKQTFGSLVRYSLNP